MRHPHLRPGAVSETTRSLASRLRSLAEATRPRRLARWRIFQTFAVANNVQAVFDEAIYLFVAAQRIEATPPLKWSSVGVYVDMLRTEFIRRGGDAAVAAKIGPLRKYIAKMAAGSDSRHAKDLSHEQLNEIIELLHEDDQKEIAASLTAMLLLGLRAIDLLNVDADHLKLEPHFVRCEVRVAKNRAARSSRVELRIPRAWVPERCRDLLEQLEEHRRHRPQGHLFRASATVINDALRRLATTHEVPQATTYSFRRAYVRNMVGHCVTEDGLVDGAKLQRFTLHVDERTVHAYYVPHVSDDAE